MKVLENKEKEFEKCIEINSRNRYSKFVIDYMIRWADMMEERISNGEDINNIAEETSHRADTEGITGFMYGCAVDLLSQFWKYGDQLKIWHNSKYGYEGEGTVNPAIITIG
jgi:hypothetical protein